MTRHKLTLRLLDGDFAICRLPAVAAMPDWVSGAAMLSITRTREELSIVCEQRAVPEGVVHAGGWRLLQAIGPFDFNLTGVLASLTGPLADAAVPVFAISTYDTDYLLVRKQDVERAVAALSGAGHTCRCELSDNRIRGEEI